MRHLNTITYHMICTLIDHYQDRLQAVRNDAEEVFIRSQLRHYTSLHSKH